MNFYPFHIGDYISHTYHLSDAEDLAYRRMIDMYYLAEQPFNDSSTIARKIRSTKEAVDSILSEFFTLEDDGCWHNKRIDEEIAKYHDRLSQASRAGKASAEARLNKRSTSVQPTKNQEPRTINQINTPEGVSESVFKDYLEVRKTKKAKWTETALKGLTKEAQNAGISLQEAMELCCARGWVGFKADWIKDQQPTNTNNDKAWMFSDAGIVAKASELGIHSIGLSYKELKDKCLLIMAKRAMQ